MDLALGFVSALLDDIEAMREHDARLRDFEVHARTVAAVRALAQTEACKNALRHQSVRAMRLYLEQEIARPTPPTHVRRDPVVWDLVKDALAGRLARLGAR